MGLANYSDLKTAVADWLDRADLSSKMDDFIDLAEARFNREVRLMSQITSTTFTTGNVTLPSDFLESIVVYLDDTPDKVLTYVPYSEFLKMDNQYYLQDKPGFYSFRGNTIYFIPGIGTNTVTMVYYAKHTALSNDNTTNNLLTNHPDVYLYGTLIHSAPFIGEDTRIQVWEQMYQTALAEVKKLETNKKNPRSELRQAPNRFADMGGY